MSLFISTEEKEKKKEEKKKKQLEQLINKYHLKDIDEEDYELIKEIGSDLCGTTWGEISVLFDSKTTAVDQVKVDRLAAIQDQNWIIINQLGRINKNLKELIQLKKEK